MDSLPYRWISFISFLKLLLIQFSVVVRSKPFWDTEANHFASTARKTYKEKVCLLLNHHCCEGEGLFWKHEGVIDQSVWRTSAVCRNLKILCPKHQEERKNPTHSENERCTIFAGPRDWSIWVASAEL